LLFNQLLFSNKIIVDRIFTKTEPKMIQLSDINNAYVFINTTNKQVKSRIDKLTKNLQFEQFKTGQQTDNFGGIFFKRGFKEGKNTFFSIDKANDQGDYELGNFDFNPLLKLDDQLDSLISYCFVNEKGFVAGTDYLAIFNHFYYHDKDTFICSNNMFIVAALIDDAVSEEALFETLFFRFPYKNGTYFKSVKALKPYQQIFFSLNNEMKLSSFASYDDIILKDSNDISTEIDLFFSQLKNPEKLPTLLTLSGGSDSTTILSILQKRGYKTQLASYKGHNELDTKRIKKLAKKTGLPYFLIDTDKYEEQQNEELQYSFLTNGYTHAISYYHFYKNLPKKYQVFDGYSMMLGDWSDAFLNYPYRDVIKGEPIDSVLQKYFSVFDAKFLRRMSDYLDANYKNQLIDVNTPEGLRSICEYAIDFIPSKLFSRTKVSTNFGHVNVSFFQSRKFISFIEKNKLGIAKTVSARNDYPNYIVNRLPLGITAHGMDKKINSLPLSYGLSLSDMYKNDRMVYFKKKLRTVYKRILRVQHKKKAEPKTWLDIDTSNYSFLRKNVSLDFKVKRELSIFNSVYSIMEKLTQE